jgi:hypothetical protein
MTEKLLQAADASEAIDMEWVSSSEEYASIGKVAYDFTLLSEARKKTPEPPEPENYYRTDNTSFVETPIASHFRDVYMVLMNVPSRAEWMPGVQKVEQDIPQAFVGSIHQCTFDDCNVEISPIRMVLSDEGVVYAESWKIKEMNVSLVYEFVFKRINDNTCGFACRFLNAGESPVPESINALSFKKIQLMSQGLKEYCEKTQVSFFEPAFQKN